MEATPTIIASLCISAHVSDRCSSFLEVVVKSMEWNETVSSHYFIERDMFECTHNCQMWR